MTTRVPIGAAILAASLLLSATTGPSAQPPAPGLSPTAHAGSTPLADGRLLISGGATTAGIGDALHLVGPRGVSTDRLLSRRADHRATLLPDGRVLISGGADARGSFDALEIVDAAGGGIALPPLRLPRAVSQHTATLLPDGRVLVTGGWAAHRRPTDTVQALDLGPPHAVELIDLAEARAGHTATVLMTGEVLIAGGEGARGILDSAEMRGAAASAVLSDRLSQARAGHTATLLPNGDVLIAGGIGPHGAATTTLERFDAESRTFHQLGSRLHTGRAYHLAMLLRDGRVLFWGGVDAAGRIIGDGEIYDPRTGAIDRAPDLPRALAAPLSRPAVAESHPADRATGVPAAVQIALRFSEPIAVTSVSETTVRLAGPGGAVAVAPVPVEAGLLLFVTPATPLAPGTLYTLTLDGLRSTAGVPLPATTVSFTTAGTPAPRPGGGGGRDVTDPDEDGSRLVRDERTGHLVSKWQDLPLLEAPPGVTALAGQVLQLNGDPLPGVTLEVDGRYTRSDRTGRFLLGDLPEAGARVLVIDGRGAHRRGATYGVFEVSVDIAADQTTPLGYAIWMPKIDWANAVRIPSPTTTETVISTPRLPGLELRLPPNTVVRDRDGKVVTEISLTPVPTERPPFPLPDGVSFPIYLTTQPGGARLETSTGGASPGAPVVYPNYFGYPPGTEADFWKYEPENGRRWYRYGKGTVDASGQYFEPSEYMRVRKFTMFTQVSPNLNGSTPAGSAPPPSSAPPAGGNSFGADPVDLSTGLFVLTKTDLALADVLPLALTRTYRQNDTASRAFGIGANHPYNLLLYSENGYLTISLILPDGGRIRYQRTSTGTSYTNAVLEHTETPTRFYKSVLQYVGPYPGTWTITLLDGTVYRFVFYGDLSTITDRFGNAITLTRELVIVPSFQSPLAWGKIQRITGPSGRWIDLTYDSAGRIAQAADPGGRVVGYSYDTSGRLVKVVDAAGGVTEYTYDASHRMLTIKDARGIVYLTNTYNANGRVQTQTQADSTTYQFAYTLNGGGAVTQTDLTNPRAFVQRVTYSTAGYSLTDTQAQGNVLAQTLTYTRQSGTNFILTATDQLSRQTAFTYNTPGNVASMTRLNGTADAVTTSFTYETGTGTFNRLTSITTPIATTTLAYNDASRTITITDPLSHATVITQNTRGQVATIANALSHTTTFSYDGVGNLTGITDPLSNQTTRAYDSYGRLIRQTDPKGKVTLFSYDTLNQLRTIADAKQGTTRFAYDANGNLLNVTDARGNATSYTYNSMDRLATRTDPLTRPETYSYDNNGNLTSFTDRKSQTTTLAYDALDRLTGRTYADSSTIAYAYDAGNRLTQVVDSIAGTITPGYDGLDRLVSEATPNGTVSYTYDALGRRLTMNVPGQGQISYGYDLADRLLTITQGNNVVTFDYDNANRRTKLTYPSGTSSEYAYDTASRLTGLTYKHGGNTLGTLTYTYDLASQRTQVGGSWARTGLPATVASATYNAANQQTAFGGATLTYDLNGNLTGDGTNTHTWNARDQLGSISGPVSGSFVYDAFGRRQRKTINSAITDFVYDGLNPVKEAAGASTIDLLTGLGIDEYFSRADSVSSRDLLSDALGSTVSLADSSGGVQTEYSYEPFGAGSASGTSSANELHYTGREEDGTSLNYYRARYYSPSLARFLSEEPLGISRVDASLYTYTENSPVNSRDPLGLWTVSVGSTVGFGAGVGGGGGTSVNIGHNPTCGWLSGWSVSVTGTAAGGAVAGFGSSLGLSVSASNASDVSGLLGRFYETGRGGLGRIGVGYFQSPDGVVKGGSLGLGLKSSGYLGASAGVSDTSAFVQWRQGHSLSILATDGFALISIPLGKRKSSNC